MGYRYKEVKDINPQSPTYNQTKWIRDPDNDNLCVENRDTISVDRNSITFSCFDTESVGNSITTKEQLDNYRNSLKESVNILDSHRNLEVISKPDWINISMQGNVITVTNTDYKFDIN